MVIKSLSANSGHPASISIRCLGCRQIGVFKNVTSNDFYTLDDVTKSHLIMGLKHCPNTECGCFVYVVYGTVDSRLKVIATFPPERIDFDSSNIPPAILNAFEEAITCHANQCYIAAAIMIRKTLEELCNDKNITGNNLRQKITALGSSVILPSDLLLGVDVLRLLGNDAAHVESQEFNKVGRDEIEIAIEFTKELLKSVYQYTNLLNRLNALRK